VEEEQRYWSAEGNTSCKKKTLLMKRGGKAFSRGSDFFFFFALPRIFPDLLTERDGGALDGD